MRLWWGQMDKGRRCFILVDPLGLLLKAMVTEACVGQRDGAAWLLDRLAKLWDAQSCMLMHILSRQTFWVLSAAFSPDDKTVLMGSSDSSAKLWDAPSGALLHNLEGDTPAVANVAYPTDGKVILTGYADGTVILWDAQSGTQLCPYVLCYWANRDI